MPESTPKQMKDQNTAELRPTPETNNRESLEPEVFELDDFEPDALELITLDLEATDSDAVEMETAEPGILDLENSEEYSLDPETTESGVFEFKTTEPENPGPEEAEPETLSLENVEPDPLVLETTEPDLPVPDSSQPDTLGLESSEPDTFDLEIVEPAPLGIESSDFDTIDLESIEPDTLDLETTEQDIPVPGSSQPDTLVLESSEPDTFDLDNVELDPLGRETSESDTLDLENIKPDTLVLETTEPDTLDLENIEPDTLILETAEQDISVPDSSQPDTLDLETTQPDTFDLGVVETEVLELEPAGPKAAGTPAPPPASQQKTKRHFTSIKAISWQPGDIVLDHYLVEKMVADPTGEGGTFYDCRHRDRPFRALLETPPPRLLTSPAGLRRIVHRAEQRIRLGMHPNLAAAFNLRFANGMPVMIGEMVPGESLADRLAAKRCGNDLRSDLSLAIQFCHGLEHCHSLGIIHGRLAPATIMLTPDNLLKVIGFGLFGPDEQLDQGQLRTLIGEDIRAFGLCLWQIFCAAPPYPDPEERNRPSKPQPANPDLTFPVPLQVALLRSTANDAGRRYRNFAELRQDLNLAYKELFNISSPYFLAPRTDYRAEILNNQAVMLLDEGKNQEAARKLAYSLEIDDTLPEAIYNNLLFRWRLGRVAPARILNLIEANRHPERELSGLNELEQAVTARISEEKSGPASDQQPQPEFRLIPPPRQSAVYRHALEQRKLQQEIRDHLQHQRYREGYDLLLDSWKKAGFRRDKFFNRIYEELLAVGKKGQPFKIQRFLNLCGHQGPVLTVASVPGSRRIVSLNTDGWLFIHDLGGGGKPEIVENRELNATCLAVCPNGTHLAVGDENGWVYLLSPVTGKITSQYQSHRGTVSALAFNHDGMLLASGDDYSCITVRHLSTGEEDAVFMADSGVVRTLLYPKEEENPNLISGSEDGVIRTWEADLGDTTAIIPAHAGSLNELVSAAEGSGAALNHLLISAGSDHRIRIWQRTDGKCRKTLKHGVHTRTLLTLADGKTLFSAGEDDLIQVWNLEDGEKLFSLDGRGNGIFNLARGPRPHTFLAGRADGIIDIWIVLYQLYFDTE